MSDAEAVAAEISQGPTREVLQLQYQFAHLLRQFDQEQDARDLAAARANLRMRAIIKQRVDSRQRKHNAWNKFRRLVKHVQLFASFLNSLYTEVRYRPGRSGALEAAEEFTAAASRTRSRVFDSELESLVKSTHYVRKRLNRPCRPAAA